MHLRYIYIIAVSLIILVTTSLKGQELSEGELELEMKAFDLFENKEYVEAMPLFSQLLSLYPKEPDYNFGYAVCLIETNTDPRKAIDYLDFASLKSDNPVIYFYLGRAYHLIYEFDEALKNYGSFKSKASKTDLKTYSTEQYISMARNGKTLVRYISDLIVHDNKKIGKENFHYSYELEDYGGKLIIKPPDFKTKVDNKKGDTELMFVSDSGFVYYSSYGEDKKGSRDIYRAVKMSDGSWGEPEKLSTIINSQYDEDYPFIHTDGKTLYFSSKGHNSMGGYDIFRCVYDSAKNNWAEPENLDFPTNSPYDDYLFISDANEDYAYFASNRETGNDRISVYKIEIDKEPIEREYNDIEEVIQKSKLEVTPLALRTKNNNSSDNENSVNQYESNTANRKELNYNFNKIEFTNDLSATDLLEEANNDIAVVEEDLNTTKKESNIAYLLADEKNRLADEKRQEAEKVKNTNPELAQNLTNEANELEQEAITAFNLAKNLDKSANEKEKDVQKIKDLTNDLASNETASADDIYSQLNNNREELNKSIDKSVTIDTEIDHRQELIAENNDLIGKKKENLNTVQKDIENTKSQISELENRYVNSNDDAEKDLIEGDLEQLADDLEKGQIKEVELVKEINKLTVDNGKDQKELAILEKIKSNIENNNATDNEIAENVNLINKDELEKTIFDKELMADHNEAKVIDDSNSKIEHNLTNYSDNENSSDQANNTSNENHSEETDSSLVADNNNSVNDVNSNNPDENGNVNVESNNATDNNAGDQNNDTESNTIENSTTENSNVNPDTNNLTDNNTNNETNEVNANSNDTNENTSSTDRSSVDYLEIEARKNRELSDSLYFLANEKRKLLENTEDIETRNSLEKEINELEELADIKRSQSDDQFAEVAETKKEDEIVENYISYQDELIDNNPVFSFGSNEQADSKVKQYEKELFNARYYENLAIEQEKKLDIMRSSLKNISDDEVKKSVEGEISKLEKLINYSKKAAEESGNLAAKLKDEAITELDDKQVSSEYLLVKATEYEPDNDLGLSNVQEETLKYTAEDRKTADGNLNDWYKIQNEIEELEQELESTEDDAEQKKINKQIGEKEKEANEQFQGLDKIYSESNDAEFNLYSELINKKRAISNDRNLLLANELEKEADLYFEKAKLIREDANIIEDNKEKNTELIKAKNYELIAIQKKRHALDLYIGHSETTDTEMLADNNSNNSSSDMNANSNNEETTENKNITLLPEEEKQLKLYRKESHKAETLESEAQKLIVDIQERKQQADNTYSEKEKKKLLNGIEEKEQKAKDNLEAAYITYGTSDSLKYHLYKSQIEQLSDGVSDVGSNKLIADQYSRDADFYYEQGRMMRDKAKTIENQEERIEMLARAVEFEKKALYSHEVAVDVLMNVDPVDFASSTALTKVDRLEVLNQPVNIDHVKKVRTDRIIEKLDLPEEDLAELDKANKVEKDADELVQKADDAEKRISELENVIETTESSKVKKKAEKDKEKEVRDMYSNRFAAGDLSEQVNDSKYWVYKDNLKSHRVNGRSDIARQGRQLEKEANKKYNSAKSLRDKSFFTADVEEAYNMISKADSLEKSAIEDLEKAYGLYLELPSLEEELIAMKDSTTETNDIWDNLAVRSNADITPIETTNDTTAYLADNNENDPGDMTNRNAVDENNENNSDGNNGDDPDNRTAVNDSENNNATETNDTSDTNENSSDNTDGNNGDDPDNRTAVNNSEENNGSDTNNTADNNESNTNNTEENNANTNDTENNNDLADNNTTNNSGDNTANDSDPGNMNNRMGSNTGNSPSILNYSIEPVPKYSSANPIPMNPPLPDGIVFKVQVGAFRRTIPQDAFGGLSPISGEKLQGSAFTRYMVGLFNTYEGATIVKDEVKTMGYRDAFIVAYLDGKRVPLYQARNSIRERTGEAKAQYDDLAQAEVNAIKNRTATVADNTTNTGSRNVAGSNNVVSGSDLKQVNGLLYTVQIGVYKQAITHDKLYNLSPIYEEKTQYGFTRYTTGVFNNYEVATSEKDRIVRLGISDAFVAVYFNGKRITLSEARNIESSNGSDIYANTDPVKMAEQPVENNSTDLGDTENLNIVFKVQIGAYKEQVPTNIVSDFIRVAANHGLDQEKDDKGVTVYTVGKFTDYENANQTKTMLINEGIGDAFVVSYNGNKKIPVSEALRLLSQ